MLLKRIEIHGFKSFADRTEFELGRGVTCLVGPNGCGKSNVVDAVKWALGEQRPTALRGDQMADVIFKGNGRRSAMGFAEVTLVFDNAQGLLPLDAAEVAIGRRLTRDGESEYFLNRRVVRLREIRELFVDTGLGQNTYAVLEQGRIDAVLNANPVDRRHVFEEAAGIQKFRLRKRETARKLERVGQNLDRVSDLIDELEKRERSLKVQAGRARTYVNLSDRLTERRTLLFLLQGVQIESERRDVAARLAEAERRERETRAALEAAERTYRLAEQARERTREAVARMQERLSEVRAERRSAEERLHAAERRARETAEAASERGREREEAGRAAASAAEALEQVGRNRERAAREAEAAEAVARKERARVGELERELEEALAQEEERERLAEALRVEEVRAGNERSALETRIRKDRAARERTVRREVELAALIERGRAEVADAERRLADLGQDRVRRVRSADEAARLLERRRQESESLRTRIARARAERAALQSRYETLRDVVERHEGVGEAARRLLEAGERGELDGVLGLLADHIEVPAERARAVDAALGPLSAAVVVDGVEALERARAWLRDQGCGAATFVLADGGAAPAEGSDDGGFGERLLEHAEGRFGGLLERLVRSYRLVDDDRALLEALATGRPAVTSDGVRVEPHGALTDPGGGGSMGLVERKAELERLSSRVREQDRHIAELEQELARAGAAEAEAQALLEEALEARRELDEGLHEVRSVKQRLLERVEVYRRELALLAAEHAELEEEERAARRTLRDLERRLAEVARKRREAEAELGRHRASLRRRAETLEEAKQVLARAERERALAEERLRSIEAEAGHVEKAVSEARSRVEALESEIARLAEQKALAEREIGEIREALEASAAEETELVERLERARAEAERAEEERAKREREVAEARSAREEAQQALHEAQLVERDVLNARRHLLETAREELDLDLEARLAEFDPSGAPALDQVEEETRELKERIARLGNVNLDAITELEEVSRRLEFLKSERTDLEEARRSLEKMIKEMEDVSRERFLETFNAVREHFRTLFRKLFQGGRAEVRLEEGKDELEAGIEIVAAPPGKEARSITLLSGGERTLTALALLFALFKAKPAPIAILDEVDAALDEANIERFCGLLGEFLGHSQFLIVTHSKRTMSYADVIYGVTMEERGISKRIGIRLEEYEEKVA